MEQPLYFLSTAFSPRMLEFDSFTKDVGTASIFVQTPGLLTLTVQQYTGPVVEIVGSEDQVLCATDRCGDVAALTASEHVRWPKAQSFEVVVEQGSGHDLNLDFLAQGRFNTFVGFTTLTGFGPCPAWHQNSGGANYVSYKEKITEFLTGQPGFRKHLTGRVKPPAKPADLKENATKAEQDVHEELLDSYEDEMDEYLQKQAAIASILTNSWPDDVHQQLIGIRPVHKLWESFCALFENKSVLGMVDLLVDLLRIECTGDEDEDVLAVIDRFIKKRNEYISAGGQLPEEVYAAFLIKAMPSAYRSTILTTFTAAATIGASLNFETVRTQLKEAIQFDVAQASRKREEAKAMAAKFERHKQQQQSKNKRTCHNCGYSGHIKAECRKPGGDKEGVPLPPKKGKGKGKAAAAAAEEKPPDASESHAYVAAAVPDRALRASGTQSLRLLDTGASQHYDGNLANFVDIRPCEPYQIQTASGIEYATQIGTVKFMCHQGDVEKTFTLSNTYYLESCTTGLISLTRLRKHGLIFSNAEAGARRRLSADHLAPGARHGGHHMRTRSPRANPSHGREAHERLGHIAHSTIETMARNGSALGFEVDLSTPIAQCEVCIRAKMKGIRISKKHRDPRSKKPGDFVSGDLWGPTRVAARGGYKYYGTFLDDDSDLAYVYLQKGKTEVETLGHYRDFEASMKTQHGVDIKEYTGGLFDKHLASKGTARQLTPHDTPQLNGAAERLNGTIAGQMRALLLASELPKSFWGLAVMYVVWLRNRTPTKKTAPKSPYEIITGEKPDLSRARRFGCRVWVRVHGGSKLDERGVEAKWVGPSMETPDSHKIYWPSKGSITVERDVRFDDEAHGSARTSDPNTTTPSPPAPLDHHTSQGEPSESPSERPTTPPSETLTFTANDIAPDDPDAPDASDATSDVGERPSRRIRKPSEYVRRLQGGEGVTSGGGGQFRKYARGLQIPNDDVNSRASIAYAAAAVPRSYRQAEKSEIWPEWDTAMRQEVSTLEDHKTFSIVTRDTAGNASVLPLKWVYANKTDDAGNIKQRKARICVRGDLQKHLGFHTETFAPVLKPTSRNILLAVAAHHGWHVRQCDFKGAYLNGVLPDPVYVEQPEGFDSPDAPRATHIWQLHKALYGLPEAGRIWYLTVSKYLVDELGYTRSEADHAVFYRTTETEQTYIGIHVDDPITVSSNLDALVKLEEDLNSKFPLKINGDATHYLGITIHQDRAAGTISLSQASYIRDLVVLTGQENAKSAPSPLALGARLGREFCPTSDEEREDMHNVPYRTVVGSLLWLANNTRPDIAYPVSILSQFLSNPGRVHWEAAKRVVRYLKGTEDAQLTLGGSHIGLVGYSDSSWGSEVLNWRSMSGYAFTLYGGTICWSAKKHRVYRHDTRHEGGYVDPPVYGELFGVFIEPTVLHVDNQSAIAMAKNDSFHSRTKHIALPYHFVRHAVASSTITLSWVPSDANLADLFTKTLDSTKTSRLSRGLGLTV
ncbi:Transcription factor [Mycena sanguinolenta]|uniref:Transcription factor n=1 Tax=Mycena sanguinolenta TaxID=230812 RepID=A0A8H6ZIB7_9AGAR|nr:Transcription factor [Mycena sanguinolenta]